MSDYFVALDGGGTGTRARAYSPHRKLIGEAESGASSLSLGIQPAWANIDAAIQAAVGHTAYSGQHPKKIVAGLAGSRNASQRNAFINHVAEATQQQCTIEVVSDAYTSALGALGGQSGIVIAIGTGVAACAIDANGQPYYTSGWGFKVGDEGAGSWMGLQAVQAYLKHLDGRNPKDSQLFATLKKTLGTAVMDIQQWCLHATATDFAALAKPIIASANENDALAKHIVKNASAEIVETINALAQFAPNALIVLLGGLGQAMRPYLPASLSPRLTKPQGIALDGAAMILFGDSPTESHS